MSYPQWTVLRLTEWARRGLGLARYSGSLKHGSPFVSNLRLQWMNLGRKPTTAATVEAKAGGGSGVDVQALQGTIQLLGDEDRRVDPEDESHPGLAAVSIS